MSLLVRLATALVLVACVGSARAGVPAELPIQGLVADKDGARLNGPVAMRFALYVAEDAASPTWSETQTVMVSRGYFAAYLGEVTPLDPATFVSLDALYVGVAIADGAEIGRLRVASTAFAFRAESARDAEALGGRRADAFALANVTCPVGMVMRGVGATGTPGCVEEADPVFAGSVARSITSAMMASWSQAHAWGDHAAAGYLTVVTDPRYPADTLTQYDVDRLRGTIGWDVVLGLIPFSHVEAVCAATVAGSVPLRVPPGWVDGAGRTGDAWCAANHHSRDRACKAVVSVARKIDGAFIDGDYPATCASAITTPWPIGSFSDQPTTAANAAWPFTWLVCCGD